jgi:hypothetical protein
MHDRNSVDNGHDDHFEGVLNQSYTDNNDHRRYKDGDEYFKKQHNNLLHFGEFKDDRMIFKNAVENSQYKLIERPTYLLSFNQNQFYLEENFRFSLLKDDQWRKFVFLGILNIFNKLALAFYLLEIKTGKGLQESDYYSVLYVYIVAVVLLEILLIWRVKTVHTESFQGTSYLLLVYFVLLLVASGAQFWKVPNDTRVA